jgi:CoA:oxalate CoA-transferase
MESMMMLIPGQIQAAQMDNAPAAGGFRPVKAKDGFVMVCIVSEKNMQALCEAMNRPDMLVDERFAHGRRFINMDEFVAEIETWSSLLSMAECETRLNETGVPCSVYNTAADLFDHPQVLERSSFTELEDEFGTFLIQNAPFKFASIDGSTSTIVPALGEQTDEVLSQVLNLSETEIEQLRQEGTIT